MADIPTWVLAAIFAVLLLTLWHTARGGWTAGWREAHRVFIRRSASLVGIPTGERARLWRSALRMMFDPLFDRVFYIYWLYVAALASLVVGSFRLGWLDWERLRFLSVIMTGTMLILYFCFHFYPRWLDRRTESRRRKELEERIAKAETRQAEIYRSLVLGEEKES